MDLDVCQWRRDTVLAAVERPERIAQEAPISVRSKASRHRQDLTLAKEDVEACPLLVPVGRVKSMILVGEVNQRTENSSSRAEVARFTSAF